jgi:hypothetical protein
MTLPRFAGRTLLAAVLIAMLAVAGVFAGAGLAGAAPVPADAANAPRITFGVQPGVRNAPDTSRADFSYSATPGARMNDYIAFRNYAYKPVTLQTYAKDAYNSASGAYAVLRRSEKSKDLGAWITLDRTSVTIPARSFVIVPFHIALPANATPGDHDAGILAGIVTQRIQSNGKQVSVEDRVGARVHIRVSGKLRPELLVRKLKSVYHGSFSPFSSGSATVSYEIANTGNIRFSAAQELQLSSMLGGSAHAPKLASIPELLPGNSVQQTVKVTGVWPGVRLKATVVLIPAPSPQFPVPTLAPIRAHHSGWAIPWTLLVLLALVVAGAVWYVRRRRRLAAEAALAAKKKQQVAQRKRKPELVGAGVAAGAGSNSKSVVIPEVATDDEAIDLRDSPPMKVDLRNPFAQKPLTPEAIDLRGESETADPDNGNPSSSNPTGK